MCSMRDIISIVKAEAGVAVRALFVGAAGYGSWLVVSGRGFEPTTLLLVSAVLFAAANLVFVLAYLWKPGLIDVADTVERGLGGEK